MRIYSRPWLSNNSQPVETVFRLKGKWNLVSTFSDASSVPGIEVNIDEAGKTTVVTTTTVNARPLPLTLQRVDSSALSG
ncbi:hypothetical protein [Candidatus Sororendozoicomonas aggregata]|uniref:hypothetical protein n=1 Tax=Candidatus Sororendozoicomonas aggregata TaxID=3073239 RepID=UPI002ED3C831